MVVEVVEQILIVLVEVPVGVIVKRLAFHYLLESPIPLQSAVVVMVFHQHLLLEILEATLFFLQQLPMAVVGVVLRKILHRHKMLVQMAVLVVAEVLVRLGQAELQLKEIPVVLLDMETMVEMVLHLLLEQEAAVVGVVLVVLVQTELELLVVTEELVVLAA